MVETITTEDERAKEGKLMRLVGITEAPIEDADQGFMVATICRVLYFVIFLSEHSGAQVQWKDNGARELKICSGKWLR